jgi:hypothetical protein
MGLAFGGRGVVLSAEFVEEPGRERLECPADSVLTGQGQREPGG